MKQQRSATGEAGLGTLPETGQTREDQKVAFRTGLQWPLLARFSPDLLNFARADDDHARSRALSLPAGPATVTLSPAGHRYVQAQAKGVGARALVFSTVRRTPSRIVALGG